jgi:hypothetical protein
VTGVSFLIYHKPETSEIQDLEIPMGEEKIGKSHQEKLVLSWSKDQEWTVQKKRKLLDNNHPTLHKQKNLHLTSTQPPKVTQRPWLQPFEL